jgi:hypothetical protein
MKTLTVDSLSHRSSSMLYLKRYQNEREVGVS